MSRMFIAKFLVAIISTGILFSANAAQDDYFRRPKPPRKNDRRPPPNDRRRPPKNGNRKKQPKGGKKYSIEQAISDRAQLTTIAFSGLAFITGDFGACSFIPPGKVCDFFGFQYMRDIDVAQKGHNPMFLNRVAGNVMHILTDRQKQKFLDLAAKQAPQLKELAKMRLPLIKAFCLELKGNGSKKLNMKAVTKCVGDIFAKDAELSWERAKVMAEVNNSLTSRQKAYFAKMKFGNFNTWPAIDERNELKRLGRGKSKLYNVAYMTYASEFFSWVKGSVKADTYFCPERHGTYFGGFYMKDMPAMGKRDYDISTSVTGDSGEAFVNKVLNATQRKTLTSVLDKQRLLLKKVITVRRAISVELRKFLSGGQASKAKVIKLGRQYGVLDGKMSYYYAKAFAEINQTLTNSQRKALVKLRNLKGYKSAPYYIYSTGMRNQPTLGNVDAFFSTSK